MATLTKPIALDETLQRIAVAQEAQTANANLIYLPIATVSGALELAPTTAVYRVTPTPVSGANDSVVVTIPTPDISDIPTGANYFCFELEVAVDDDATTLVSPPRAFDATATYAVGDLCVYDGKIYSCSTAHEGTWDAEDFTDTEFTGEPPADWVWLDKGEPPTSGFAGKTLHIACRLDCTTRAVLASTWRTA